MSGKGIYPNFNQFAPSDFRKMHFIERAKALWGDTYDYSDLEYTTGKEPCVITCPKHGKFRVAMAQNHLLKNPRFRTGCPCCKVEEMEAMGLDTTAYRNKVLHQDVPKKNHVLSEEEKARRKAERDKEQARKKRAKQMEKENRKLEMIAYVQTHGYETANLTYRQISHRYASIKSKEKNAYKYAELARQREERKAQAKIDSEHRKEAQRLASLEKYRQQAIAVHGDKYDYSKMDYVKKNYHGKEQWILTNIICPKHGPFETRPDVHIRMKCQCPSCANLPNRLSADQWKEIFLDRAHKKFGDRFDYSKVVYKNKRNKVLIRCKEHDYWFKTRFDDHVQKAGCCPFCTQSSGEADIRKYLDDHGITYWAQWEIHDHGNPLCKRDYLVADFYLPAYKAIIEFNGQQHYMEIPYFHARQDRELFTLEDQKVRDQTLRDWCKAHSIKLLEIPYTKESQIGKLVGKFLDIEGKLM